MKVFKEFSFAEHLTGFTLIVIVVGFFLNCLQKLEAVGTYLSGVGTFGLLVIAVIQIPREINKFRHQKKEEKITEITFELTESLVKFISTLQYLIDKVSLGDERLPDEPIDTHRFRQYTSWGQKYRYRITQKRAFIEKFYEDTWKARYLDCYKELDSEIQELKRIHFEMSLSINELSSLSGEVSVELVREPYLRFFSITSYEDLESRKERVLNLLNPHF